MKHFKATFIGRKPGAIGCYARFTCAVSAESKDEARDKLFSSEEYAHVHGIDLVEVSFEETKTIRHGEEYDIRLK